MDDFFYRIHWRSRGHLPGGHRGTQAGAGFEFTGHRLLTDGADPRRLDIRASLRDPFERWQVRVFAQRSAIPVVLLADMSASMAVQGRHDKWTSVSNLAAAMAWSVSRNGDLFSFVGCDDRVREELFLPPTQRRAASLELASRVRAARPTARAGASALLTAAQWLPQRRALVFLVTDFHHPAGFADALLASLQHHDVVPVVLWDPIETQVPKGRGLLRLQDSETGEHRLVWLRSQLKDAWRNAIAERRQSLLRVCEHHGRAPLIIEDAFHPDQLTRYFHAAA